MPSNRREFFYLVAGGVVGAARRLREPHGAVRTRGVHARRGEGEIRETAGDGDGGNRNSGYGHACNYETRWPDAAAPSDANPGRSTAHTNRQAHYSHAAGAYARPRRAAHSSRQPTSSVPGVPNTGALDPSPPEADSSDRNSAPITFRVFYDYNKNKSFDKGESIRGITVYFRNEGDTLLPGGLVTTYQATDQTRIPLTSQRVYIPYLGINMPLKDFPAKALHWLWIPAVNLPDRVP